MTSFQEFLRKKAEEQQVGLSRERRDEWVAAVDRLIGQIGRWLYEADPDHLLELIPFELEKAEVGLGLYKVYGLKISVGSLNARVIPVARNVTGAYRFLDEAEEPGGRVDITSGVTKYILIRIIRDKSEAWVVRDDRFGTAPLDQGRLLAIIEDLLG